MKEWTSPELTVLVRSKPEEAVLVACKGGLAAGAPETYFHGCQSIVQSKCTNSCVSIASS